MEIQERFEDLLLANPDFDESLLEKDEEGCYLDSDIQYMCSIFETGTKVGGQWQAAKSQAVPEGFVLLAIDDMERICRCLDDHAVYITYKASDALESIQKAMIEAQERSRTSGYPDEP